MASMEEDPLPYVDIRVTNLSKLTKTQQLLFSGDYTLIKTHVWMLYSSSVNFVPLDAAKFYTLHF